MRTRIGLFLTAVLAVAVAVLPGSAGGRGNYVFTYFQGNGEDGLHLAYSADGLTWKPLGGGKPFFVPAVGGKLMRDPFVMLGPDNIFHAVWTTGWYEQGIGLAHSKDLVTWSEPEFLPVMVHERKAANAWAPELIYDDETRQYILFWATTIPGRFPETDASGDVNKDGIALNHRLYRTTTRDFKEFTRAELFVDPGFSVIDATIVRDGLRWVMFLKNETKQPDAKKDIRVSFADHALGPYTPASDPISPENWVEGPTAFRVGDAWYVLFDAYTRHRYEGVRTRDFKTWEPITDKLKMPEGARHGTVLQVPDKILKGLLAQK